MKDDSFVVEAFVAMWKMLNKITKTINGLKKVFNFCTDEKPVRKIFKVERRERKALADFNNSEHLVETGKDFREMRFDGGSLMFCGCADAK